MRIFITSAFLILLFSSRAWAETEHVFSSGHCANGNTWWAVATVVDGTVTTVTGVDCNGVYYRSSCSVALLPTDPFAGETPTMAGVCQGSGAPWHALLHFNELHQVIDVVGQNCMGEYYKATPQPASLKPLIRRSDAPPSSPASPGRNIH